MTYEEWMGPDDGECPEDDDATGFKRLRSENEAPDDQEG